MPHLEVVSVLAGGWSVEGLDLQRLPGHVIAVNDAAIHSPRVDSIVSMDRLWTEYRWNRLRLMQKRTFLRDACFKNIDLPDGLPRWVTRYECNYRTTEMSPGGSMGESMAVSLNGTNSGMVAINLAYLLATRRVYLFGFDMNRHPKTNRKYWYPDLPWTDQKGGTSGYKAWATQFRTIAAQFHDRGVEVINASPNSAIPNFPKCKPEEALA